MRIEEFDALEPSAAREVVQVWADIPPWTDAIVSRRPFASVEALHLAAAALAESWTPAEIESALAHHPRIGERPTGDSADAAASRREQAAASGADSAVLDAIRDGNAAYERRFDRVFLIRAAGRSADEILDALTRRLESDDATEAAEVAGQLREIALLRLDSTITDAGPPRSAT